VICFQSPLREARPATTSLISPSSMNALQKFAHCAGKTLEASRVIVSRMKNRDLRQVVARNLNFFMQRESCLYRNPNALGVAAKVAPNTVRNLLNPKKRTVTISKPEGYPTLDKLERIAQKLPCEVWELLHPDIEKSIRERETYMRLPNSFFSLSNRPGEPVKQ
jgi:hypothetical protein